MWETDPFMLRRVCGRERTCALICIRCAEGLTDVWVEAVTPGMVSGEGGLDTSSPGNTPATEVRAGSSEGHFPVWEGGGEEGRLTASNRSGDGKIPKVVGYAGV